MMVCRHALYANVSCNSTRAFSTSSTSGCNILMTQSSSKKRNECFVIYMVKWFCYHWSLSQGYQFRDMINKNVGTPVSRKWDSILFFSAGILMLVNVVFLWIRYYSNVQLSILWAAVPGIFALTASIIG